MQAASRFNAPQIKSHSSPELKQLADVFNAPLPYFQKILQVL
jgi:hypothetical protein